jgi:hypothetical protein
MFLVDKVEESLRISSDIRTHAARSKRKTGSLQFHIQLQKIMARRLIC